MASSRQLYGDSQASYGSIEPRRGFPDGSERGGSFEDLSRQISNLVFKINGNATILERQAKKIGTTEDGPRLREKLHNVQHETNDIAANITGLIKNLHGCVDRADKQRRIQVERLKTSFRSALQRYGGIQEKVTDFVKSEALRENQRTSSFGNEEPDTWTDEATLLEVDQRKKQLQQQQIEIEDELAVAREREDRIRQIESDVLDVNEIFKELGTMVQEQGEIVDDIETNVVTASDYVDEGNTQLERAVTYQKSYRKKLCILAIILVVVLGVVAVIIAVSIPKSKK